MELGSELFFWCGELNFRASARNVFGFFVVAFFGGVFAFFGGDFAELISRNGAEQNGGLPPWSWSKGAQKGR